MLANKLVEGKTIEASGDYCYLGLVNIINNKLHPHILLMNSKQKIKIYKKSVNMLYLQNDVLCKDDGYKNIVIYYSPNDNRDTTVLRELIFAYPELSFIVTAKGIFYSLPHYEDILDNYAKSLPADEADYGILFFCRFISKYIFYNDNVPIEAERQQNINIISLEAALKLLEQHKKQVNELKNTLVITSGNTTRFNCIEL